MSLPENDLDHTASNNLCYTDDMQSDRSFWPDWARFLQQRGLSEIVAALLDAAGPVHLILANLVYAGQPLISQVMSGPRLQALASLFENQSESKSFAAFLREETSA